MTVSLVALSLAMGVIEGSPFRSVEGGAPLPGVGYVAVTTAVTVGIIIGAALRPRSMMTTGIWILTQGLGITALLLTWRSPSAFRSERFSPRPSAPS